jgi:pescadillo
MLTFLEFYQTLVSFVNYRLYTSINLLYPPTLDISKDNEGAGLAAYQLHSITRTEPVHINHLISEVPSAKDTSNQLVTLSATIGSLTEDDHPQSPKTLVPDDDILDTFLSVNSTRDLPQPTSSLQESTKSSLFQGLHIYISRETPVDALSFLLLSCGVSSLSTDPTTGSSPYSESDPRITHQICDRGRLPDFIVPDRKYIQPQWVFDSINSGSLLDESLYTPGAEPPAHLSPFVEKDQAEYDPQAPIDVQSDEEVYQNDMEDSDTEHQRLILAEVEGVVPTQLTRNKKEKVDENKEAKEMTKIVMSNKNKRLLEAMEYSNRKRSVEKEKLQKRKKTLLREGRKKTKVNNE